MSIITSQISNRIMIPRHRPSFAAFSSSRIVSNLQLRQYSWTDLQIPSGLPKGLIHDPPSSSSSYSINQAQNDLKHAVDMVRNHDPAGYLPGRLLPTTEMQWTYYAVRSFWVETGLRFGTTAMVPPYAAPSDHLDWWTDQIDAIYDRSGNDDNVDKDIVCHPTIRLLQHLLYVSEDNTSVKTNIGTTQRILSKCHFDDIIKGRREDLDIRQYATLEQLEEHAIWSCGSLSQLILESDGIYEKEYPLHHKAAKLIGQVHGITNALRLSIPIVSTTGKLILPEDLCLLYGVKSPRYLLSALGQGDIECRIALQNVIRDIIIRAKQHLYEARSLHNELSEDPVIGSHTVAVLLPALTSETFLRRLEYHNYDLTDRNLRNVNMWEHTKCALRLLKASYLQQY